MSPSPLTYQSLLDQQLFRRTVIIGAGIVGSAIASYLSIRTSEQIVVLDRCHFPLNGSTGHAPGFVGQLNESLILTALAKESVQAYRGMPGGFADCGGLEVARTEQGMEILRTRFRLAETCGLPARLLGADETIRLAPDFIRADQVLGGLHFLGDGTADAHRLTATFRSDAESRGVVFFEGEIRSTTRSVSGAISSVGTSLGAPLLCTSLVLATGIWTADLINMLDLELPTPIPIVPVAHPYVYSRRHTPRPQTYPFIRWPESQIYARDHGSFDGIGSYNHAPIAISRPASTALAPDWPETFAAAITKAIAQLHNPSLFTESKLEPRPTASTLPVVSAFPDAFYLGSSRGPRVLSTEISRLVINQALRLDGDMAIIPPINGIFAMTPDNLPLVGPIEAVPGLYLAAAIWVTHAAGCARLLADMMFGDLNFPVHENRDMVKVLRPGRFAGLDSDTLKQRALDNYNHIYRSGNLTKL